MLELARAVVTDVVANKGFKSHTPTQEMLAGACIWKGIMRLVSLQSMSLFKILRMLHTIAWRLSSLVLGIVTHAHIGVLIL